MAQADLDRQAVESIRTAFVENFGVEPTENEVLFAAAVSRGESNYGRASYKNRLTGQSFSNTWNMGGVQCGHKPPCDPATCFEATDTHANGEAYQACFRKYATQAEGFEHFLRVLYVGGSGKFDRKPVRAAANEYPSDARISELLAGTGVLKLNATVPIVDGSGKTVQLADWYHVAHFSRAQRDSGYFELALSKHVSAMVTNILSIQKNTGLMLDGGSGHAPTPKAPESDSFSREEWLSLLGQSLLQDASVRRYAKLPMKTEEVLRRYQLAHGLKPDGVPGPITLKALLE